MIFTFDEWRKRFERSITVQSPAWSTLKQLRAYLAQEPPPAVLPFLTLMLSPAWAEDIDKAALELLYTTTCPPPQFQAEKKKRDAHTRKALHELIKKIDSFVGHLETTSKLDHTPGDVVVSGNRCLAVHLQPLLVAYIKVAEDSRYFLSLLKEKHVRQPSLLGRTRGLIGILEDLVKVKEAPTLDLVRLTMLAHGCSEDELQDFEHPNRIKKMQDHYFGKAKKRGQKEAASFMCDAKKILKTDKVVWTIGPPKEE
jgi:hypothetical protein